ncbi:MAG: DMT family transporter [Akkermansiaceae bacterium]
MSFSDAIRLMLLSAIWGASFLFMRIAVPEFGPFAMIFGRIGGGALVLLPVLLRPENRRLVLQNKASLFFLGFVNAALPFCFFGFAATSLAAGFTSLLNASTPIFTAIVGFLWLRLPLLRSQILGLLIGFLGIAILTGDQLNFEKGGTGWPIVAVLMATCSYGVSSHYAKTRFANFTPLLVSAGSLFCAALILLPLALLFPPPAMPSAGAIAATLTLAFLCTAFAFVLFFDLLNRTGATAAATVTFVIPVFGVLWGALFLHETVSVRMIIGMAVALLGTAFVTKLLPLKRKQNA